MIFLIIYAVCAFIMLLWYVVVNIWSLTENNRTFTERCWLTGLVSTLLGPISLFCAITTILLYVIWLHNNEAFCIECLGYYIDNTYEVIKDKEA